MKELTEVTTALVALVLIFITFPLVGVLFGAFSGWVVGWFFRETMAEFFGAFGLGSLSPWQIGAMLGFSGGFFKSSLTAGSK
jgi:hypothetical protein